MRAPISFLLVCLMSACAGGTSRPTSATNGDGDGADSSAMTLDELAGRWRCAYSREGRPGEIDLWIAGEASTIQLCPPSGSACGAAVSITIADGALLAQADDRSVRLTRDGERLVGSVRDAREGTFALRCDVAPPLPEPPPRGQEVDAAPYPLPDEPSRLVVAMFQGIAAYHQAEHLVPGPTATTVLGPGAFPNPGPPVPSAPLCEPVNAFVDSEDGIRWYEQIDFMPEWVRGAYHFVVDEEAGRVEIFGRWDADCDGEVATIILRATVGDEGDLIREPLRVIDPYE